MLVYLLGAFGAGSFWLNCFLRDETTPKTDLTSWIILTIATVAWPICLPLSCLELLSKEKSDLSSELSTIESAHDWQTL